MKNVIEIESLKFSYHHSSGDLISIDQFLMKNGEKVFLYGPSGSGKSTFLNLIGGILSPHSGKLVVCGEELTKMSARKRDHLRGSKLGIIFQQFNLLSHLSALENIMLPGLFHKIDHLKEHALELCHKLDLEAVRDQKASTLSLGQQQRVAAARALVSRPKLILADEPTSSLDDENTERFLEGLFTLAKQEQTSILLVSHDRRLASSFDRSVGLSELQGGASA